MLQDEYEVIDTKINDLKDKRADSEEKLKYASNEDDMIEYKFQIMKINEELISLEEKHKILSEKINKEREIKEQQEKEKLRKDKLYKKLYVTLDDKKLNEIKRELNIYQSSKDEIIKELITIFSSEKDLFDILNLFNVLSSSEKSNISTQLKSQKITVSQIIKKYNSSDSLKKFKPELKKTIGYIVDNYDLRFSGYFHDEFIFEKNLYSYNFEDMDRSDWIDADYLHGKLKSKIKGDFNVDNDFEFDIVFPDEMDEDCFYEELINAKEKKWLFDKEKRAAERRQAEFERKRNNESTYKKNVARYDELIAEKRRMKNKK